jgi:hypothetical protein
MKRFFFGLATVAALVLLLPSFPRAQGGSTFTGELMDAICAPMGSHTTTMQKNDLTQPLQCVWFCLHFVTPGSRLVLYDSATKTVYNVDDMGRCGPPLRCLRPYSAEKVKITGTLDAATKTIKVTDVVSANAGGGK